MRHCTILFPNEIIQQIRKEASDQGKPVADVIRAAIAHARDKVFAELPHAPMGAKMGTRVSVILTEEDQRSLVEARARHYHASAWRIISAALQDLQSQRNVL